MQSIASHIDHPFLDTSNMVFRAGWIAIIHEQMQISRQVSGTDHVCGFLH
jgi:hypothetical protein